MSEGRATESPREASKLETRAALIAAAAAEFTEKGFDGPSLDAICARAGFTRGAFYVHFRSRDDLVAAVTEWILESLLNEVIVTGDGGAGLTATIDRYIALTIGERATLPESEPTGADFLGNARFDQVLEACHRTPRIRALVRAMLGDALRRVEEQAAAARGQGSLRGDAAPEGVAALLILLALGLRAATELDAPLSVPRTRDALIALLSSAPDEATPGR